jgi:hypothetical protein
MVVDPHDNVFILSWDQQGLEACVNVSCYEKAQIWAVLTNSNPEQKISAMLGHLIMRARANPQRHYEIYSMLVVDSITEEDIHEMFENDPQGSADLIRDRGRKLYSNRAIQQDIKIL